MRFDRSDLPFETSQAIYDRMSSERFREAKELRAQGFEVAQQIRSKADREKDDRVTVMDIAEMVTHGSRSDFTLTNAYVGFLIPLMIEVQHLAERPRA